MPRNYKCKNCGVQHAPPTGKHCRNTVENGQNDVLSELLPVLLEIKKQLANKGESEKTVEGAEGTSELENDGDEAASVDSEPVRDVVRVSDDGDDDGITPQELRKDIRAMKKAAERIARIQSDDSDDEDSGTTKRSRANGKKSGSMMTSTEVVKDRIDWPHMYVKRVVGGARIGSAYKDLTVPEFVYGFLCMLESPKCKMDKEVMLGILRMLMQDAMDFSWEGVRAFYQMIGVDVETGDRRWTDSDDIRDLRMMHSRVTPLEKKDTRDGKKAGGGRQNPSVVRCCALYQKRACELNRDHMPFSHVCAYCHKATGMMCRHAEDECFRKIADDSKNGQKRE